MGINLNITWLSQSKLSYVQIVEMVCLEANRVINFISDPPTILLVFQIIRSPTKKATWHIISEVQFKQLNFIKSLGEQFSQACLTANISAV